MQSGFSFFIENVVVCCFSYDQIFRQSEFCPPDRQDVFCIGALATFFCVLRNSGLWENVRIKCAFILLCLESVLLEDARKKERKVLAVAFPRQPDRRRSNLKLKISFLVLPWSVEAILVILYQRVALGRPSARAGFRSGIRLLARFGPPRECGCRFYCRFLQVLRYIMADLDASHTNSRFLHTTYPGKSTTGDSINN